MLVTFISQWPEKAASVISWYPPQEPTFSFALPVFVTCSTEESIPHKSFGFCKMKIQTVFKVSYNDSTAAGMMNVSSTDDLISMCFAIELQSFFIYILIQQILDLQANVKR